MTLPKIRLLFAAGLAAVFLFPTASTAVELGHPGAPTPAFSLRGSVGLGYSARDLRNTTNYRDRITRLLVIGKLSAMVHDRVEVFGTILGADTERGLTEFAGLGLGLGGGGGARGYLMLQEQFGINLGIGASFLYIANEGRIPEYDDDGKTGDSISDTVRQQEYLVDLTLSKSFQAWNLYGGLLWNHLLLRQDVQTNDPTIPGDFREARALAPVGIFVGVDYFITPLVFFTAEAQNFHKDAITLSIGMLISP